MSEGLRLEPTILSRDGGPIKAVRAVVALFDSVVAGAVLLYAVFVTALYRGDYRKTTMNRSSGLVVFDASYTLDQIRARELEYAAKSYDCDGLFDHVWSVHPLVGAQQGHDIAQRLRVSTLDACHTFVETSVTGGRGATSTPRTSFALSQARMLKYLRCLLRSGGVCMVRSADPLYLGVVGYLLARCARLPLVVRVPGNDDFIYEMTGRAVYPRLLRYRGLERRVRRFVLSRADQVFAPSVDNLEYAVRNGAPQGQVSVVPYGQFLHPVHFGDPNERPGVRDELDIGDRPLIATVNRLEPVKLVSGIVEVLAGVRSVVPDAVCVFSGDGSLREELLEQAARNGFADALILVGNRPQQWVAGLLADADVVLATLMGRALVESALSGTAIAAYDCEWHSEFIEDGLTGLLVPLGDTAAMADAAVALLNDRKRATRIGSQARTYALDVMSPAAVNRLERELLTTRFPMVLQGG